MTTKELSLEFEIMFNNIMSGNAPGLNEYEKSVFLTKGQEEILKNYFTPKGNKYQEGISDSDKRDADFSNLIKVITITGNTIANTFYKNTVSYSRPVDILFPLSFKLRNVDNNELTVIPLKDDEFRRLMSKPYKEPFKGYAYKLDNSTTNKIYEIMVGKSEISKNYSLCLRYLRIPNPVILTHLSNVETEFGLNIGTLSINGQRAETQCELHSELHREILDRAVNLAKIHYEGSTEGIVQYSSTNE